MDEEEKNYWNGVMDKVNTKLDDILDKLKAHQPAKGRGMANHIDAAARLIERRIAPHRERLRRILAANFHEQEAIALLGYLVADTLQRFPSDERADVLDAFRDALEPDDADDER